MKNKVPQITVIGSMCDISQKQSIIRIAKQIGKEIANNNAVLLFGFEGDNNSLPVLAAQEAEQHGGKTIAFLWCGIRKIKDLHSLVIKTGQARGGGREFSLILSADVIISIGGGSGTLMELSMAYQANIPIVAIRNTGGWSKKLTNRFLDERKKIKILTAKDAKDAVQTALSQIR